MSDVTKGKVPVSPCASSECGMFSFHINRVYGKRVCTCAVYALGPRVVCHLKIRPDLFTSSEILSRISYSEITNLILGVIV